MVDRIAVGLYVKSSLKKKKLESRIPQSFYLVAYFGTIIELGVGKYVLEKHFKRSKLNVRAQTENLNYTTLIIVVYFFLKKKT